jgi:hypothetical protein
MSDLGWVEGGAAWRRELWGWEERLLEECRGVLSNVVLQPNIPDQRVWRQDPGDSYTVRGAYNLLTHRDVQDAKATTDLIWYKRVSLKASVLAWRLLRNRLPTKYNVVR